MIRSTIIILIASLFIALLPACGEQGKPKRRRDELRVATPDLTDIFRDLLDRGPIAANGIREILEKVDPAGHGAELIALLPAADEAWNVEVGAMVQGDVPSPSTGAVIVEPAGRQLSTKLRILVRRPMPGRLDAVLRDHEGSEIETFDVAIGRWEPMPENVAVEAGRSYRLELSSRDEEATLVASSDFEIVSAEEEAQLRRRLKLLKRAIRDVRVRRYMQGVAAMNAGLYGKASEILGKRMTGDPKGPELGRHRRLAWLHHRRGNVKQRDLSLDALRR